MPYFIFYIIYTSILVVNGFLIFHFVFLRFFSPKNYTGSTNKIVNGYLEFSGSVQKKEYKFIYSRLGFCASFGYTGKRIVEHNLKLNIKYGDNAKLNRWKRLPKFIIILITLLILIMSIINMFFLQFKLNTPINFHLYIIWFIILNFWFWIFIFIYNILTTLSAILNYFIYRPRLNGRSKIKISPKTFKQLLNYFYFESNKIFVMPGKLFYFIWVATFWLLIILVIWVFHLPYG